MDINIFNQTSKKLPKQTQETLHINRKSGKKITLKQIKQIGEQMQKQGQEDNEFFKVTLIRVLSDRWYSYTSIEELQNTYDNYFEGKVKDTKKFDSFTQIQITQVFK